MMMNLNITKMDSNSIVIIFLYTTFLGVISMVMPFSAMINDHSSVIPRISDSVTEFRYILFQQVSFIFAPSVFYGLMILVKSRWTIPTYRIKLTISMFIASIAIIVAYYFTASGPQYLLDDPTTGTGLNQTDAEDKLVVTMLLWTVKPPIFYLYLVSKVERQQNTRYEEDVIIDMPSFLNKRLSKEDLTQITRYEEDVIIEMPSFLNASKYSPSSTESSSEFSLYYTFDQARHNCFAIEIKKNLNQSDSSFHSITQINENSILIVFVAKVTTGTEFIFEPITHEVSVENIEDNYTYTFYINPPPKNVSHIEMECRISVDEPNDLRSISRFILFDEQNKHCPYITINCCLGGCCPSFEGCSCCPTNKTYNTNNTTAGLIVKGGNGNVNYNQRGDIEVNGKTPTRKREKR